MPRPRFHKLSPQRQTELLDIAANAFARGSYHDVSYNKILAEANVSKGASYYYFDDKEDLFLTVAERELDKLFAALEPLVTNEPFWGHVEALLTRYLRFATTHPQSVALAQASADFVPKASGVERLESWNEQYSSIAQSILEEGQSQGQVRTDLPVTLLTAIVMGVGASVDRWVLSQTPPSNVEDHPGLDGSKLAQAIDMFMDLTKRILQP